ncbi:PASTA domain-containing protein [Maribellus comscasis]|uniref:PASTA domain-containing protein n=1 Tax=Maribellus comscasis TaxID=2681766 RepID=A0A6I6K578_9BACT|nr:PASTA domain-containing protein [Maribellus comscasis]
MSLKKFLLSRTFLIQIIIAAIIVFSLIFFTMYGLKIYTKHGESYPVPNFEGMNQDEAVQIAANQNLKVEIVDSVYTDDVAPGEIIDQVPEAGFRVKESRTIFLTINSTQPEQVILPKLTDISYRQAQVLIENSGFKVGEISYQPSEYNDLVLSVQIDSVNVKPGKKISKGTNIDLIIGRTQGNTATPLPNLIGLSIEEAENTLTHAMLNMGVLIYDETIISKDDSTNARVWKQNPNPKIVGNVNLGSSVDIWITIDELKIEETSGPEL